MNQARGILIAIGVIIIIMQAVPLIDFKQGFHFMTPREALEKMVPPGQVLLPGALDAAVAVFTAVLALYVGVGVVFFVLAALIKKIPVIATTAGLVIFSLVVLTDFIFDPEHWYQGMVLKIIFVVCLAKAIGAAIAYEKERREQAELEAEPAI